MATENVRIVTFADAISNNDLVSAGRVMSKSHWSLRDDYEVSTHELDRLVRLAGKHGAYGARRVGGGFGGAVLSLVDSEEAELIGRLIMDEHTARVGHADSGTRVREQSEIPL